MVPLRTLWINDWVNICVVAKQADIFIQASPNASTDWVRSKKKEAT